MGGKSARSAMPVKSVKSANPAMDNYQRAHADELLSVQTGATRIDPSEAVVGQTYIVEFWDERTGQAKQHGISNRYIVNAQTITTKEIDIIDPVTRERGSYTETKVSLILKPVNGGPKFEVFNWASTKDTKGTSVGYGPMIFKE